MVLDEGTQNFHDSGMCDWRTPCCLETRTWAKQGRFRLWVSGSDPDACEISAPKFAYIGDEHPQSLENKIVFLKSCQMLKELDGKPLTQGYLIQVIKALHDKVEKRLMHLPEVSMLKAGDPKEKHVFNYHWKLVREDPNLSIPRVGKMVRVIDLTKGAAKAPPFMNTAELDLSLDICAAGLDVEHADAKGLGPSDEKIRNGILYYSETFQSARTAMLRINALSHQAVPRSPSSAAAELYEEC